MIARIQKSMKNKDGGFTLIELLVVMIIIGILAAIAIPVFLNQRKKAVDASIKSDLKSAATAIETSATDTQTYPDTNGGETVIRDQVKVTTGNTITYSSLGTPAGQSFCLQGSNPNSNATGGDTKSYWYLSNNGGLKAKILDARPAGC